MTSDLLVELLQQLDEPQVRICHLERYATGRQPLAFLSTDQRTALERFGRMASNIPRLAVTSLAERLRVTGFTGVDIWDEWLRNDLDQTSAIAHSEALTFGNSAVIVWRGKSGKPQVSVESAKQVAVLRDPGSRETVAAVKRWGNQLHGKSESHAILYLPDRIEHWRVNHADAAATDSWSRIETLDNPLGTVPVVQLRNASDMILDDCGRSEIDDLIPLVDGLNKLLTDMLVTAEYTALPRRWATGIDLVEAPVLDEDGNPTGETEAANPFPDGDRMMIAEAQESKFGQLAAADLTGYENAVNVLLGQIMAVSALPAHYIGVMHDNPASADAIRSAEASLTARAEARQKVFGRAWEQAARLVVAVRDGVDPADVDVRVEWCDPATRSESQLSDSVTKLYANGQGLLSRAGALKRLGFTDDEIREELLAKRRELLSEDPIGAYTAANDPRIQMTNEGLTSFE